MIGRASRGALLAVLAALTVAPPALAANVAPRFAVPGRPADGPFPSDLFTTPDAEQNTGVSVHLPYAEVPGLPACGSPSSFGAPGRPSDCDDVDLLDTLDGFNVHPRLSIPFDGAIDPASVTRDTVFLVGLGSTLPGGAPAGGRIGVAEVVWDVATSTLHVRSEDVLDQHARYVLVVTRGVRDAAGDPIERGEAFARFRRELALGQTNGLPQDVREHLKAYRKSLIDALELLSTQGVDESDVAVASVFTTMSVTALLEKLHAQVRGGPAPDPADFNLLRTSGDPGPRFVFALESIARLRWDRGLTAGAAQFLELGPSPCDAPCRMQQLSAVTDGAGHPFVGRIAFGRYDSPSFLERRPETDPLALAARDIPTVKTGTGVPVVRGSEPVYFNLFLPAGAAPAGGWPVVIFGHGQGNNKNEWPFEVAAKLASHGLATLAINMVSHGFRPPTGATGPGTLTISFRDGATPPLTFNAGGRGADQNGDGRIGGAEGSQAIGPWGLLALSHTRLQTTMDLVQLIRVVQAGMDVDGDGISDLNPDRIGYLGFSGGSYVAVALNVVEPAVRATVYNAIIATMASFRLDAGNRVALGTLFARRIPPLPTSTGAVASICGVPVTGAATARFDENLPPRCTSTDPRAPIVNTRDGAMAIQEILDRIEWASQVSAPEALATYLRKTPLPGHSPTPFIFQFARGDRTDVNPNDAIFVRAGGFADRTTAYRHDLFLSVFPGPLLDNPHRFMVNVEGPEGQQQVSLQAQEQAATFLESQGATVIDPDGDLPLFEVPIRGDVPDDLGFVGVP